MTDLEGSPRRSYRTWIEVASLVLAPALMTIGDFFHPDERMDAAAQVAIVIGHPSRWYAAHLLLFIGMLLVVPGILALSRLASARRPAAGYAALVFTLIGIAALSAVVSIEMLIGRFVSDGADAGQATALAETFRSGRLLGALMPGVFLFFVGVAAFTVPLAAIRGPFRWPALVFALGAVLILIEIVFSQVRFSQIGNAVLWVASIRFAWLVGHGELPGAPPRPAG